MNTLIIVNGLHFENQTLEDLRRWRTQCNAELKDVYTFKMRSGYRRVIKLKLSGTVYSAYSFKHIGDGSAYGYSSGTCIYFGFDKSKAVGTDVNIYSADEIEDKHALLTLFFGRTPTLEERRRLGSV